MLTRLLVNRLLVNIAYTKMWVHLTYSYFIHCVYIEYGQYFKGLYL